MSNIGNQQPNPSTLSQEALSLPEWKLLEELFTKMDWQQKIPLRSDWLHLLHTMETLSAHPTQLSLWNVLAALSNFTSHHIRLEATGLNRLSSPTENLALSSASLNLSGLIIRLLAILYSTQDDQI